MRYGFDCHLSSGHGVNYVANPFKLQERLTPPVFVLLFVTNRQSIPFFPKQGLMPNKPNLITGALWREIQ